MMYVYDEDLQIIGAVDNYNSLITAKRYFENGDCEIYAPASSELLNLATIGRYVSKDQITLYRINDIRLNTNPEEGNFLTISGKDAKGFVDQRIVMQTSVCNGNAEAFILKLVSSALGSDAAADRKIKDSHGALIFTVFSSGFTETMTEQVTYKNLGEKIREYCKKFGWGYKAELQNGKFVFSFYKGADRTNTVVFSPNYENVTTTTYAEDHTKMGNFALVGGEGEGDARYKVNVGNTSGADRYEVFVDAKQLSKTIRFGEIEAAYPNGSITHDGNDYYWTVDGVNIAVLPNNSPAENEECSLTDSVYSAQLRSRGTEALAEYGAVTSFDSEIQPNITFVYGKDYFLGDIVKIENEFGIAKNARIVEIVECEDENGYSTLPKFEWITEE